MQSPWLNVFMFIKRHLAMDLIVPYVLWVALLLFLTDWLLRALNRSLHPWFQEA